jgi:hypothetical protein
VRTFVFLQIGADNFKIVAFNQQFAAVKTARVFGIIAGNVAAVYIF